MPNYAGYQYYMWYPCCNVCGFAYVAEPCWVCEVEIGVQHHRARDILPEDQHPVREGGSRAYMQMSLVKPEVIRWPNP